MNTRWGVTLSSKGCAGLVAVLVSLFAPGPALGGPGPTEGIQLKSTCFADTCAAADEDEDEDTGGISLEQQWYEAQKSANSTWFWASLGVTAAAGAAAAYFFIDWGLEVSAADDSYASYQASLSQTDALKFRSEVEEHEDRATLDKYVTYGAAGVAGVALISTVLSLLAAPEPPSDDSPETTFLPLLAPGGAGLILQVTP
jgi:hypothetical protein